MKICVSNRNILLNIAKYLPLKEINSLRLLNKNIYSSFNTDKMIQLNLIYLSEFYRIYYESDVKKFNFSPNYNINICSKNLLDSFTNSGVNWEKECRDFNTHLNRCPLQNEGQMVYSFFKLHLFLPDLRKENKYLEYELSSLHQKVSYDSITIERIKNKNYKNFIETKDSNALINPRFKNLPFESELINCTNFIEEIFNNKNYRDIILSLINYEFDKLNNIFINNKKNNKIFKNNCIEFLLWANKTIINFVNVLFEFILIYNIKNNEKKFLIEFINKHNDFINFAMLLNEKFQNINTLINIFIINKLPPEKKNDFSLYKLSMHIYKNYYYKKLNNIVYENFKIHIDKYFGIEFEKISELFLNNKIDKYNENYDNIDTYKMEIDESEDEEDSDKMITEDQYIYSDKEIIEEVMNHIIDYEINENNSGLINHTDLKVSNYYKEYEKIIIEKFVNELNIYFNEGKSLFIIFRLIKYFIILTDEYLTLNEEKPIYLIRRTKLRLLKNVAKLCENYINDNIYKDFDKYKNNLNNKYNKTKYEINKDLLKILPNKRKNNFYKNYKDYIKKIKDKLINFKNNEIVNKYIDDECDEFICFVKNIVGFYFLELEFYDEKNEIVIELLKDKIKTYKEQILKEKYIQIFNR